MLPGIPGSARCVQRFDDSLDPAIRITYRISLRSSSLWEPRHPSLKVVRISLCVIVHSRVRDYEFRYGWLCIGFKKSVWVPLRECSREQYAKRVGSRVMYTTRENQKEIGHTVRWVG